MVKPTNRSKSARMPKGFANSSVVPASEDPSLPVTKLMRDGYDFSELAAFVRRHDPLWVSTAGVPVPTSSEDVLPRGTK